MIKISRTKIKQKNKIPVGFGLPKIKHDLIIMISKYKNKMLDLGKTQAVLNDLSA